MDLVNRICLLSHICKVQYVALEKDGEGEWPEPVVINPLTDQLQLLDIAKCSAQEDLRQFSVPAMQMMSKASSHGQQESCLSRARRTKK
ncbi:hypothetical protein L1987_53119 [Smallanthus sonchifolius]|uniref:Uncharacterized protein n=1 Tax=Smallanthus sonchifolius TaxID=185202 RepID=A0ACB9EV00_9ASTR|nr:hypothetical protein L1987_53119 [Smallanthus sonchifolius]